MINCFPQYQYSTTVATRPPPVCKAPNSSRPRFPRDHTVGVVINKPCGRYGNPVNCFRAGQHLHPIHRADFSNSPVWHYFLLLKIKHWKSISDATSARFVLCGVVYGRPFPGRTASIGHHLANLLSCLRVGYLTTDGGRWSVVGCGYSLSVSLLHCSSDVRNADMKHNNKFRPISRPTSEYTSRVGSAPLRRVYEPRVEERHYYFYTQSGILGCWAAASASATPPPLQLPG